VVGSAAMTHRVIEHLPSCLAIVKSGVGVDNIDVPAATEHGICVANVPDYGVDEVATHAMALLLDCLRRVTNTVGAVRRGEWVSTPSYPIRRSAGCVLGIVGFGRIGISVARKAQGFDWRVLAHDPYVGPETIRRLGAEPVGFDRLLAEADFVTLHLPLTEATYHLIGAATLSQMKPSAHLINTARGGLVDTLALHHALETGQIAGAALDVLEEEPPSPDHPLLNCDRALITSHVAWYSQEALADLRVKAAQEVGRVLRGELPRYLINANVRPRWQHVAQ